MGPKKGKGQEMSKKTEQKMKNSIIEDKTFGLKNKNKSKVVQNYVKQVQNQVNYGQEKGGAQKREAEQFQQKKEKKKTEQQAALLASIFKSQQNLKTSGADAEIINSQKVNLYQDPRQGTDKMPQDTIITCKHFLDAVEQELYGWRWTCPNNGVDCQYRHMLPEGYVLTTKAERAQAKKDAEDAAMNTQTLEEKIEEQRMALSSEGLTPVTKESFFAWKARRAEKKQRELEEKMKEEEAKLAAKGKGGTGGGKRNNIMSGRALFAYNPDLFKDDENAGGAQDYEEEEKKESEAPAEKKYDDAGKGEEKVADVAVDQDLFAAEAGEVDEDVDFD